LLRALRRDSDTTKLKLKILKKSLDEMVHGDVFRSPSNPMILSVMVGNGAQVFFMAAVTVCKGKYEVYV